MLDIHLFEICYFLNVTSKKEFLILNKKICDLILEKKVIYSKFIYEKKFAVPQYNPFGKKVKIDDKKQDNICKWFYEIERMDLSLILNNHITQKINTFTNLKKLILRTSYSGKNEINNLTKLEYLDISYNIFPDSFGKNMKNLKVLKMEFTDNIQLDEEYMKYFNLKFLSLANDINVKNLNFLTSLKHLAIRQCSIGEDGFKNLNLESLWCSYNKNIINLNYFSNLQRLEMDECISNNDDIKKINPIYLSITDCKNITNINWMSKLRWLIARQNCAINNQSISDLDLISLDVSYNNNFTHITNFTNLIELKINGCLNIKEINNHKLKILEADHINNLKFIVKLNNLETLSVNRAAINEDMLNPLKLKKLIVKNNFFKFNLGNYINLTELDISGSDLYNDSDLEKLNLVRLNISHTKNIRNLNHMSNLQHLDAKKSDINYLGLFGLNIKKICLSDCNIDWKNFLMNKLEEITVDCNTTKNIDFKLFKKKNPSIIIFISL